MKWTNSSISLKLRHCYNAYLQLPFIKVNCEVQGFCRFCGKTLALEQSQMALKDKAFNASSFVQYAL